MGFWQEEWNNGGMGGMRTGMGMGGMSTGMGMGGMTGMGGYGGTGLMHTGMGMGYPGGIHLSSPKNAQNSNILSGKCGNASKFSGK